MQKPASTIRGLLPLVVLVPALAAAERGDSLAEAGAKTVLGTPNPALADGARALLAGNAEEGVRLTRLGLGAAGNDRERQAGLSNLCAGYLRLEQPTTALAYCNQALDLNPRHWRARTNRALAYIELARYAAADDDLRVAEEVAPGARTVQLARGVWRDATDPVVPTVVIDDRRDPPGDGDETDD